MLGDLGRHTETTGRELESMTNQCTACDPPYSKSCLYVYKPSHPILRARRAGLTSTRDKFSMRGNCCTILRLVNTDSRVPMHLLPEHSGIGDVIDLFCIQEDRDGLF